MKRSTIIILLLTVCSEAIGQPVSNSSVAPNDVIAAVKKAQQSLRTLEYTVKRTDTLLSDDTRFLTGRVLLEVVPQDTIYGFHFFSKQDGDNSEQVYDGYIAYITDQDRKHYQMSVTPSGFSRLRGTGGGRLLMPDLIKLDTSNASKITLKQDEKFYHLVIHRPDLTQYDVINRHKSITIDKSTMIPIAVREHQESYGKKQDVYYHISALKINHPLNYSFFSPPFLKEYAQYIPTKTTSPTLSLVDNEAPVLALTSFDDQLVKSDDFKGKVVLLDFWEVWCGPCIISMPKIENIYQKYKNRGFQVYGIVNDVKQLSSAKFLVKNRRITFPMLIGSSEFKKDYKFEGGVPMYILIDKSGKVSWVNWGDAPDMEEVILRALQ